MPMPLDDVQKLGLPRSSSQESAGQSASASPASADAHEVELHQDREREARPSALSVDPDIARPCHEPQGDWPARRCAKQLYNIFSSLVKIEIQRVWRRAVCLYLVPGILYPGHSHILEAGGHILEAGGERFLVAASFRMAIGWYSACQG
jgi:hypothetical protein